MFCPRIVEGELRLLCVGPDAMSIVHKKPAEGSVSAVGGTGATYTFYDPGEAKFAEVVHAFKTELPLVMARLGLSSEPFPLLWTVDFIPAPRKGWIVGEFNCSCVGLSKCLPAVCTDDSPSACWGDIPASDVKEAMRISDKMGNTVLSLLYWYDQCLAQPTGEAAVFEC